MELRNHNSQPSEARTDNLYARFANFVFMSGGGCSSERSGNTCCPSQSTLRRPIASSFQRRFSRKAWRGLALVKRAQKVLASNLAGPGGPDRTGKHVGTAKQRPQCPASASAGR